VTLTRATGYQDGYSIWIVRFDVDRITVLEIERPAPVDWQPEFIRLLGSGNPPPHSAG
jgi:hypothetical protein